MPHRASPNGEVRQPDEGQEYFFREGCYILELQNEPDHPGLSIARARLKPGVTTRAHRLLATEERYLIFSGKGEVFLGEQPPRSVQAGDLVIIPAGTLQRIRNTGDGDLVFHALCTPRFRPENYRESE